LGIESLESRSDRTE